MHTSQAHTKTPCTYTSTLHRIEEELRACIRSIKGRSTGTVVLEDGLLTKKVFKLNPSSKNCVVRPPHEEELPKLQSTTNINALSVAHYVARFPIYLHGADYTVDSEGTAFVVAKIRPNTVILATAAHNVRPVGGKLASARYICLDWHKTDMVEKSRLSSVTVLGEGSDAPAGDLDPISLKPLEHQQDVAFIRAMISDKMFARCKVLVPTLPPNVDERPTVGVIGWPAALNADSVFPQGEAPDSPKVVVDDTWVTGTFFSAMCMCVSVGKVDFGKQIKTNTIGTHSASTLKGFSGSPMVLVDQPGVFCGIHVSGAPRDGKLFKHLNHNVFLSTLHPVFVNLYKEHVLASVNSEDLADDTARRLFDAWRDAVST